MAHIRQSRPDSGLGFHEVVPSSLGSDLTLCLLQEENPSRRYPGATSPGGAGSPRAFASPNRGIASPSVQEAVAMINDSVPPIEVTAATLEEVGAPDVVMAVNQEPEIP